MTVIQLIVLIQLTIMTGMLYQSGEIISADIGEPFIIEEIENLLYACTYINTKLSFLMEKEKFDKLLTKA